MRALVVAALLFAAPAAAQHMAFFTVGAGTLGGGYFSAARAICERINRDGGGELRCSPDPTTGSIYNIEALRAGRIDFALVQSDWQRRAFEGTGRYEATGPMDNMRSVMGLYPELVTVLARRDAGIAQAADILGKRVDVGHPSSGRYATNLQLLEALGVEEAEFRELAELPVDGAIRELCAGRIDATLLIVGHPNAAVARALSNCSAELVPVTGADVDAYVAQSADYVPAVVTAGTYPGLEADVPTFAVTATLVTRTDVAPGLVEKVVRAVLDDLPLMALRAPVLDGADSASLALAGLTAPLHPAAKAAYDAAGD